MAKRWYYVRGGQETGPITSQELRDLAAAGTLRSADLVWAEGMPEWREAGSVVGLFPAANGGERPEPPPLPKGRTADAGHIEASVAAGGSLAVGLGKLIEKAKGAARLAAAQARKAHLVNVTLRAAHLELGRDIYAAARFRDEFREQYAEIDEAGRQIEHLTSTRLQVSSAKSLADWATKAAAGVKVTAQAKALSLKKEALLRQLGEACFQRHGDGSGPAPLVHRIADDLLTLGELDREIQVWRDSGKVKGLFPSTREPDRLAADSEVGEGKAMQGNDTASKQPWYCHWVVLAPTTLICFPITLVIVWWKSTYSPKAKWTWTGASVMVLLIGLVNSDPKQAQEAPKAAGPAMASSATSSSKQSKEKKSYKISKGWGRGSIEIELPKDYDLGIDFADFELSDIGRLSYTLTWHWEGENPTNMRWTSYDSKGVKLDGSHLDFGETIRSDEPTRGMFILGFDKWEKTTRIKIE